MNIDVRQLRHLLAVARHPSLRAAADALHLTQPALSKSIARFEDELGASLFVRRGRRLALTELGRRVVARAELLLRDVRHLEEEITLWKHGELGEVVLGVGPVVELMLLPEVLARYVDARPSARVKIRSGHTGALLPALRAGELHAIVADYELAEAEDDLETTPLAADTVSAAVRPDHPLVRAAPPSVEALQRYPVAGASPPPRFLEWSRRQLGVTPDEIFGASIECDNYEVLVRTAARTDCVLLGPSRLLREYARAGRLHVFALELPSPATQPSLIRQRGRALSPAAEQLLALFPSRPPAPG